jgi:3-dehydroquinate synthase
VQTLRVALGERSYPIHMGAGILDDPALYRPCLQRGKAVIVTSDALAPLFLERLKRALASAGAQTLEVIVEAGEQAKRWESVERICDAMLAARCGRDSLVVALGGGVVGDLAGFAAAVYQRGVPFVQVPTSLLAQVDSSVGGKTGINHARGKNMIGAFHQPLAVIADVAVLGTLPERELSAGLAEVVKHGFILDAEFAAWLEENIEQLRAREVPALVHAVRRSCEIKAEVVARDERESEDIRALLNFGHTFGHAIEAGTGYGTWLHGEAVGTGMVMAAELSSRAGMLARPGVERVRKLVARAGLPVEGPALAAERYLELMSVDKKASGGKLRFIVLETIGRAVLRGGLEEAWIRGAIEACTPGLRAAAVR